MPFKDSYDMPDYKHDFSVQIRGSEIHKSSFEIYVTVQNNTRTLKTIKLLKPTQVP